MTTPTSIFDLQQTRDGYHRVKDQIAEAALKSHRKAEDIYLVAVTKTATLEQINTVLDLGQIDLGENRVQQLVQRVPEVQAHQDSQPSPRPVRWHLIGHLQRNKAKQAAPLVHLIHSVDTIRLAEELHHLGAKTDTTIDILLQVNMSGELSKSGMPPAAVIHLIEQIKTMINLRLRGIMTMAPYSNNPEDARPIFARTAELFHEACRSGLTGPTFNLLSMGMSGDFSVAIEEGANVVRVGRSIFGEPQPA